MRGKQAQERSRSEEERITPARAGKTTISLTTCRPCADHPRACGENEIAALRWSDVDGSPPRVRGKRAQRTAGRCRIRITPARAGKTPRGRRRRKCHPDHPRACGENLGGGSASGRACGSPPRVRGKPASWRRSRPGSRITPARAGKTVHHPADLPPGRDHPRACGENQPRGNLLDNGSGSPPRVRGKLYPGQTGHLGQGITPARAGKTDSHAADVCRSADHPRACGENISSRFASRYALGSPPRVRGKPVTIEGSTATCRITPARAGKT